jgi:hypothetical protein
VLSVAVLDSVHLFPAYKDVGVVGRADLADVASARYPLGVIGLAQPCDRRVISLLPDSRSLLSVLLEHEAFTTQHNAIRYASLAPLHISERCIIRSLDFGRSSWPFGAFFPGFMVWLYPYLPGSAIPLRRLSIVGLEHFSCAPSLY